MILLLKTTEGTQGYSILKEGVEEIEKSTDGFSMLQFEKKLGIIEFCLDLEVYGSEENYYMILACRDDFKNDLDTLNNLGFIEITQEELVNQLSKGFKHTSFGTQGYHVEIIKALIQWQKHDL